MKGRTVVGVMALMASATASAAADPELLKLVMPEAKVLYGVEVEQTLVSPFGRYAISHLPQADAIARLAAATGFELQRDLQEILIASSVAGNPADGADTLVLARGTFAPDRFIALATLTGAMVYEYRGVSVITPRERNARVFAFLDSSTAATGSEAAVRGAIDRRDSQTYFTGPLMQKAQDTSASNDLWFATMTPLADLIPAIPTSGFNPTVLLESVIESRAGAHFDAGGVTLAIEALTHSDAEAQGLAGILKLVSGMLKGTPAAAFQNAQIAASGSVMRVKLSVAEQDLERSFPFAAPQRAAR